jgi:hypothetical protein
MQILFYHLYYLFVMFKEPVISWAQEINFQFKLGSENAFLS